MAGIDGEIEAPVGAAPGDRLAPARPAATVTLVREAAGVDRSFQVFLVRRHVQSEFVPDVFVFPGGSVDGGDREAEQTAGASGDWRSDDPTRPGHGFRAAAIRECFEEAGVLLAKRGQAMLTIGNSEVEHYTAHRDAVRARTSTLAGVARREGLTLAVGDLLHWAHWVTPEGFPKRFDTHFFLAAMPQGQKAIHDRLETTESVWITPEEALARYAAGTLPLVLPTERQLQELQGLTDMRAARSRFAQAPVAVRPRVVRRGGREIIVMPGDPEP